MNKIENMKIKVVALQLYSNLKESVEDIEKVIGQLDDTTKKVLFAILGRDINALIEVLEELDEKGEIF